MARARNIKPGFFENEVLAELPVYARLLFIRLWQLADKEGRLEDRPKRIKGSAFPYEDIDCNPLLQGLHDKGFILRYEVDGERYIQVLKFKDHQNPHIREAASVIPAPEMKSPEKAVPSPEKDMTSPAVTLNPVTPFSESGNSESLNPTSAEGFSQTAQAPSDQPKKTKAVKKSSPKPKPEKAAKPPPDPRVNEVFKWIENAYGEVPPHPPTQCREIKGMLRNHSPDDICACWFAKYQERDGWIELSWVAKDIVDWKRNGRKLPGRGYQNGNGKTKRDNGPAIGESAEDYFRSTVDFLNGKDG